MALSRRAATRATLILHRAQGIIGRRFSGALRRYWIEQAAAAGAAVEAGLRAIEALIPADAVGTLEVLGSRFTLTMSIEASEIAGGLVGVEGLTTASPEMQTLLREAAGRMRPVTDVTRSAVQEVLRIGQARGYNDFQIARGVPADNFRGIRDVVKMTYKNRDLAIARTEMAISSQRAAHDRYAAAGVTHVDIQDGPGCGWTSHDDPDTANGSRRTLAAANAHPTAHPNCIRVSMPVLD